MTTKLGLQQHLYKIGVLLLAIIAIRSTIGWQQERQEARLLI